LFKYSTNNDFGLVYITGSVAGTVYYDSEDNNLFDGTNLGLSGQLVTLTGLNAHGGYVSLTTTTDASGSYLFPDVEPGNYSVSYVNSSSYTSDSAQAGTTSGSQVGTAVNATYITNLTINPGDISIDHNFGLIVLSSVAGTIYYDTEDNNMYNSGTNPGLSGQTVTLSGVDLHGNSINLTTTTDANGAYSFG